MDDTPGRVDARETHDDVDERTREIRQEIDETRTELTETIDAIQEKLKPRNIVANATERVKSATIERVRDMADTAGDTARQAIDYTRDAPIVRTARQNPWPLALIGIGTAWLLANRSRRASSNRRLQYGGRYGTAYDRSRGGYVGDYSESGERYEGDQRSVTGSPGWVPDTRDRTSDTVQSLKRMARRRQNQLQHMVQDNPVLVGAGAMLLGAAFALAVPETEAENEWMGETRDNVVGRAREMARDAADQVQEAAGTVADAAKNVADRAQP